MLLRIFFLVFLFLLVRRLVRAFLRPAPRRPQDPARTPPKPQGRDERSLTDQDIDDADFEEIP